MYQDAHALGVNGPTAGPTCTARGVKPAQPTERSSPSKPCSTYSSFRVGDCVKCANDPAAGSPTATLLRLLLPLSDKVHQTSCCSIQELGAAAVRIIHRITQSVGATGGVYKGQGRIQCTLMTHTYKVFLVYTVKLQSVIPYKEQV